MIHVIVFSIVTFLKKKETVNYDTEKKLKKKKDIANCSVLLGRYESFDE